MARCTWLEEKGPEIHLFLFSQAVEVCFEKDWLPLLADKVKHTQDQQLWPAHVPLCMNTPRSLISASELARWGTGPDCMMDAEFLVKIFKMGSRGEQL